MIPPILREKHYCKQDGCRNQLGKRNVSGLCYLHYSGKGVPHISGLRNYSDRRSIQRNLRAKLIQERKGCEVCGETREEFLQLDHIIPQSLGGTDELVNLRILCGPCHEERHRHQTLSSGNIGTSESEREKMQVALDASEGSREMMISPTLWTSWNAWMKTEIIKYGFVSQHDAIHESARWLKAKWGQGSSVTTRRYLAEAIGDGKSGDYVRAWSSNLGNVIKFSEKMENRLLIPEKS